MAARQIPELTAADKARFWAKVDVRGADECWLWSGNKNGTDGYGRIGVQGSYYLSTHVSLSLAGYMRGEAECAMHSCDNPPCCNPSHLTWATLAQNNHDRMIKGRNNSARGELNGIRKKPETVRGSRNGRAKLTEKQISDIRNSGERQIDCAVRYGVSQSLVSLIRRNEAWRHVP